MITRKNKKTEIQLELFEPDKPDNKMKEVSRKEITLGALGFTIYQKKTEIDIDEIGKIPIGKKTKEIDVDDLPF